MEDAVCHHHPVPGETDVGLFGVFDGHGGADYRRLRRSAPGVYLKGGQRKHDGTGGGAIGTFADAGGRRWGRGQKDT